MRKAIIIILSALLVPACAFADMSKAKFNSWSSNISQLSYEQLVKLNSLVQARMFEDSVLSGGAPVPPGEGYIVGVDIPAGIYRIVFTSSNEYDSVVFDIDFHDGEYSHTYLLGYGSASEIGKITLSEGASITIIGGTVLFFPYTGIFH